MVWGYMVAFLLLQFLAYRYVNGRSSDLDSDGASGGSIEGDGGGDRRLGFDGRTGLRADARAEAETGTDAERAEGDGRRCPHCGRRNRPDAAFVYCRACAGRLGAGDTG